MDLRSLINKLDTINEAEAPVAGAGQKGPTVAAAQGKDPSNPLNKSATAQAAQPEQTPNPYANNPAQAAIYDRLSPEDKAWATQGGGRPDLTDQFILNRMPNKGKQSEPQAAQPEKAAGNVAEKIAKLNQLVDKLVALKQAAPAAGTTGQSTQPEKTADAPAKVTANPDNTFTFQKKDGTVLKVSADGKPLSESTLAKNLVESFGYTTNEAEMSMKQLGGGLASGAAKAGLSKAGATTAAKFVPGAGSALSAVDAYNRWKEGDHSGAVISALAGIGWLVPGPLGWVLGGGLDATNIVRDMNKDSDKPAAAPVTKKEGDPKVVALQKYLLSQGATNKDGTPLTVDGLMGPNTRAAMDAAELTESQRIKLLQMQLESIGDEQLDEFNPITAGKAAMNVGKNFVSGLKGGGLVQQMGKAGQFGKAATGARTALKTGKAIGKHPFAATAGASGAAAGLAGYGLGANGNTANPSAAAASVKQTAKVSAAPTKQAAQPDAAQAAERTDIDQQIKAILQDLAISAPNDPAVAAAIADMQKKLGITPNATAQGAQPASTAPTKAAANAPAAELAKRLPAASDWLDKIGTYK